MNVSIFEGDDNGGVVLQVVGKEGDIHNQKKSVESVKGSVYYTHIRKCNFVPHAHEGHERKMATCSNSPAIIMSILEFVAQKQTVNP